MACRAELGRFPLIVAINQKIILIKITLYIFTVRGMTILLKRSF